MPSVEVKITPSAPTIKNKLFPIEILFRLVFIPESINFQSSRLLELIIKPKSPTMIYLPLE